MLLILALRRQRQVDLYEFKVSLVYRVSSKTARATQRSPVLENSNKRQGLILSAHHTVVYSSVAFVLSFQIGFLKLKTEG